MMVVLAFVFGLCIGSFLNVVIWRLPHEQSLNGRSHCPHCHHKLVWYDLLPLVSFVLQGRSCRYCKKLISFRYPLIEALVGFLFAGAIYVFPPGLFIDWVIFVKALVIIAVCVVVFVIDLEHYLILDKVVYTAASCVGVLLIIQSFLLGSFSPLISGILAAVGPFVVFWIIWYISTGSWMGYGDVKFVALMGLMLGWPGIIVALFLAFILGAIFGLTLILIGKKKLSSRLPFGTFLSLATVLSLFFSVQLWQGYWDIFLF